MSISKRWIANQDHIDAVLAMYRSVDCPTLQEIADFLGTTYHTVHWICKNKLPEAEYKALNAIRYSHSKQGEKNPMYGKSGEQHIVTGKDRKSVV